MRRFTVPVAVGILGFLLVSGCEMGPKSGIGLSLPDGDAARGRAAFIDLGCHSCHDVNDVDLPAADTLGPVRFELGGPVTKVETYGALVSSIVNPSHDISKRSVEQVVERDGESLMVALNDTMTVQQLIDLVAFLQPQYDIVVPVRPYYYP
jgi:hypothetical protein